MFPWASSLGVAGQMFAFPKQEVWETDQEDWIPRSPRVQTNAGGHRAVVSDRKTLLTAPHGSWRPLLPGRASVLPERA